MLKRMWFAFAAPRLHKMCCYTGASLVHQSQKESPAVSLADRPLLPRLTLVMVVCAFNESRMNEPEAPAGIAWRTWQVH